MVIKEVLTLVCFVIIISGRHCEEDLATLGEPTCCGVGKGGYAPAAFQ
jgi:hypothetical protein